jgi:hypothetical protein
MVDVTVVGSSLLAVSIFHITRPPFILATYTGGKHFPSGEHVCPTGQQPVPQHTLPSSQQCLLSPMQQVPQRGQKSTVFPKQ